MAGTGSGDLHDLCLEYLDACALALEDTPAGPPGRQAVSTGPPPLDCEQLIVYTAGPAVADTSPLQPALAPGHRAANQGMVNLVFLVASVIRCVPGIDDYANFPSGDEITAAALQTNADLWAIWNHIARRKRDATLFAPKEREMFMDPAVTIAQGGGFGGWIVQIRVQLDGYIPTI